MINVHSYDTSIAMKLKPLVEEGKWPELCGFLNTLSNAQFRTAGIMLGSSLTDALPDEKYWPFFSAMTSYSARAFLGTLLKQVAQRLLKGTLSLQNPFAVKSLQRLSCNEIDVQKSLAALLPLMKSPEEIEELFTNLSVKDYSKRIAPLLKTTTIPCAFMLMRALKYMEHDRILLIRTTHYLIKRGDSLSFNLASILKTFFALDEVHGTFSLQLQPYELARIEQSYQAFHDAMRLQ